MLDLSVALPDSSLSEDQTTRDKSAKIGQIARACAIFRVGRIFVYHDQLSHVRAEDVNLMITLLTYLDTPQYLRKAIYPRMRELEYAGILHPIKAPHHKSAQNIRQVRRGEIRVGLVRKQNKEIFVEVGLNTLIPFEGAGHEGKKVNVVFLSEYPNLRAREAEEREISEYWGYKVTKIPSLTELLSRASDSTTILTSRKGTIFRNIHAKLEQRLSRTQKLLVVFGSPKNGVHDILAKEIGKYHFRENELVVNMFQNQGTETVRLEEAILGTFSILNACLISTPFGS